MNKIFIRKNNGFYWFYFSGKLYGPYDNYDQAKDALDKQK